LGVLVVFGSESDKPVYGKLMQALEEKGVDARLEICSAHREPKRLEKMLGESKEPIAIAGAGLSAALPGFIASHSEKLVIGIPVNSNYFGLDALLSIHQMPKGFAVLGTGVEAIGEAADGTANSLQGKKKVVLVTTEQSEAVEKKRGQCAEKLRELGVQFEKREEEHYTDKEAVYIDFVELGTIEAVDPEGQLVIFVPVKEDSEKKDALRLATLSARGLWVGLGRAENAAICAKKIIEIGKKA
jgi:5-(carboxyamino)imidazole ribonucleotide mutase